MTLSEQVRSALEAKSIERQEKLDALEARQLEIETLTATEKRDASDAELESLTTVAGELREIEAEIEKLEGRASELEDLEARQKVSAEKAKEIRMPIVENVKEPLTYRADNQHTNNFIVDAYQAQRGVNPDAAQRIARHEAEMRDVGTSAFAGLVVPQYATDLVAELARPARNLADNVRRLPLPGDGMTVNISRITTGTAVAVQATENSAVQETNIDDTLLTVNVRTIAGQQDMSRQAVERGTGTEDIVVADLVAAYHAKLDNSIINDDGTSGTHLGIRSTSSIGTSTYTDASPTGAELYPKLFEAAAAVSAGIYSPATAFVMHSRRWYWLMKERDGSSRPLVVPSENGPMNAFGVGNPGYGFVGNIGGIPVLLDDNIPTTVGGGTEDVIIATALNELFLWEEQGSPLYLRFEETLGDQLTVKAVVYGYSAFTAGRRPTASAVISGTGLAAPTWT